MDNENRVVTGIAPLSYARLWRAVKFESLSIVALLFALFFTSGYVYLEVINSKLGVPVTRLGFDSYMYAVYGGVNILIIFTPLLIAIAAVAVFSTMMHFFENPDRASPSVNPNPESRGYRLALWLEKRFKRSREPVIASLLISLVALGFWSTWKMTVSQSIERAELAAYNELRQCTPSSVQLNSLDLVTGCIVGESDDVLYLVEKRSEGKEGIVFEKRQVPKVRIRMVTGTDTLKKPD